MKIFLQASTLLVFGFSFLHDVNATPLLELRNCADNDSNRNSVELSIHSKKNETGDWVTTFSAYINAENNTDEFDLDLKQTVYQNKNKETVYLQGIFGVVSPIKTKGLNSITTSVSTEERIVFHKRTGINIRLSNGGRTAERINSTDVYNNGIVLTNRILKDNELFEVRLDEVIGRWAGSLNFGVTSKNPTDVPLHTFFAEYSKEYTWIYSFEEFDTGDIPGVPDIWKYKVGDRFGVKRTPGGDLQFFVNGIFVGSARIKVPKEIYGIIDLYGQAGKATIVNPP